MAETPSRLVAGDSWSWTRVLPEHPAPAWSVTCYFSSGADRFHIVSTPDGTAHRLAVSAATSAGYLPGRYRWTLRATDGVDVLTLDEGWLSIEANPAIGKADPRSWAARTLAAIEAFLEGNATTAQASMSVGGHSISRWTLAELIEWRRKLRAEVRIEEQGRNAGVGRHIKVRFGRG